MVAVAIHKTLEVQCANLPCASRATGAFLVVITNSSAISAAMDIMAITITGIFFTPPICCRKESFRVTTDNYQDAMTNKERI